MKRRNMFKIGFGIVGILLLAGCPTLNSKKEITTFSFTTEKNAALSTEVLGTIDGTNITATVPYGSTINALVATFDTTGSIVNVDENVQTSGTTVNDFTKILNYTVIAEDTSTQEYSVTVTLAKNPAKEITTFSIESLGVEGVFDGTNITVSILFGTDVTGLIATFTTTGASVGVGSTVQASGITANDFNDVVIYSVIAEDGTTQEYTVTKIIEKTPAKELTAFSFMAADNSALFIDVIGTITGNSISVIVPCSTNVTALVASFTTTGEQVAVGVNSQVSRTTANDFSAIVPYTVTAEGAKTQEYTVSITFAKSDLRKILSFGFTAEKNAQLSNYVQAWVSRNTISAIVPYGTDVAALVATYSKRGVSVAVGGAVQVNGTTANDFSSPVVYTVTAENGMTIEYTVTITFAKNHAKAINAFKFSTTENSVLSSDVQGIITGENISAIVPYGTDITALKATFSTTGASVAVDNTIQTSGTTSNNFSGDVIYVVTAEDLSTLEYKVKITVGMNPAKEITAFSFLAACNTALSANMTGTISGTNISVLLPYNTDVSDLRTLVATFTTTGESVYVDVFYQSSGISRNNFTKSVTYSVTAEDASVQDYTVTVAITPPKTTKALTAFSFTTLENTALSSNVEGTISGDHISALFPYGTDVTALIATFMTTGVSVAVGSNVQANGITANDFSEDLVYIVTAEDGTTQEYVVTTTIAKNSAKSIDYFELRNLNPSLQVVGVISGNNISVIVPYGTNVTSLIAVFNDTGKIATVKGIEQNSYWTSNDFTDPVIYTITAEDGTTQDFTVTTKLVFVQGGTFDMGSSVGSVYEKPVHQVTVSSFYISPYEVTQGDYESLVGSNPSDTRFGIQSNYPVNMVSWYDAVAYCNLLSDQENLSRCYSGSGNSIVCAFDAKGYRLPTEAEWEFAARGGNNSNGFTYSGSNTIDDVAWYQTNSLNQVHGVGTKAPNALCNYDMSGNVWEWCWDRFASYEPGSAINPQGISSTGITSRAIRGGCWCAFDYEESVSYRFNYGPDLQSFKQGFRVVRRP